jgi:hydrogenase maturation factor
MKFVASLDVGTGTVGRKLVIVTLKTVKLMIKVMLVTGNMNFGEHVTVHAAFTKSSGNKC